MSILNWLLWILIICIGIYILYKKRDLIKEKVGYEMEYNRRVQEAYKLEKLKQATLQGKKKARAELMSNSRGLRLGPELNKVPIQEYAYGSELQKMVYGDIPKPKNRKKSKKDKLKQIEKILSL